MNPSSDKSRSPLELVAAANQGTQNRYGEIEFVYSDSERCELLQQALEIIQRQGDLTAHREDLASALYWNMNTSARDDFLKMAIKSYQVKGARGAVLQALSTHLTTNARIQALEWIFSSWNKLGSIPKDFIEDIAVTLKHEDFPETERIRLNKIFSLMIA